MESKPDIFFSYAWGDDKETGGSREKIVNDLYDSLIAAGFNVIRDKNDLRYKGLISDLTQRIGKGKFIVVAISDKYLKSTYCMSELLEIYRRSDSDVNELLKKIFPIVLEDAKIYNPEDRVDYLEYWETKKEELNKELKGIELENASTFADDLRMYDEITSVIPVLSRLLKDMNTLNIQKLSANNFAEIKTAIINAASAGSPIGHETLSKPPAQRGIAKLAAWRAVFATLVLTTLLVVLHFVHVSSTEIRMEVFVSEINFTSPQQQVITDIVKLSSIGASGLENVQVPAVKAITNPAPEGSSSAVLLAVDTTTGYPGTITLDAIPLPAGSKIGIRHTDVSGEYRLSIRGKALSLPVQVNGFVKMVVPPTPERALDFSSPGLVHLQSQNDGVDLDLNFSSHPVRLFSAVIAADSISFMRIDQNFDNEGSIVSPVSTILSGTMYYESPGGRKQVLQRGQQIQFERSQGKITTLELYDDHIALTYTGNVGGMRTRDNNKLINLMPTCLEWLKSRVSLSLLLLAAVIIIGLVFAVPRIRRVS